MGWMMKGEWLVGLGVMSGEGERWSMCWWKVTGEVDMGDSSMLWGGR